MGRHAYGADPPRANGAGVVAAASYTVGCVIIVPIFPEFETLVPYVVVAAKLEEGPIMLGRWLSSPDPEIDTPVETVVEQWADGFCGLAFEERGP